MRLCDLIYLQQADEETPPMVVAQPICAIQRILLNTQHNYQDNAELLYELFHDILLRYLNMRFAGSAVLGKHWRAATADQRDRFISAFQSNLIRRWATDLLECYQNEFTILPYRDDASKRTTEVKTRCQLFDRTGISVNYMLVNQQERWRIFDVKIEGVSYVRNFRSQFDIEIKATSLDQLIARLENEASDDVILGGE
jgi:phospholipid transport system substrate-binding protein